jgi:hypothetical protein
MEPFTSNFYEDEPETLEIWNAIFNLLEEEQ